VAADHPNHQLDLAGLAVAEGIQPLQQLERLCGAQGADGDAEPERGRVRFAGVSVDGVGDGPVLVLVVAPSTRLTADAFGVQVTELAEANTFRDLLPLVKATVPLILER
jgi:hypothetical protein